MSYICLFILPSDSVQSEVYRILFVHVPSAIMSELIYLFLAVNGFIYLVWRTKISAIFLNSAISIRSYLYCSCFNYGINLGKTYLGDLLGMGCKNYINIYFIDSICLPSSFENIFYNKTNCRSNNLDIEYYWRNKYSNN
ncbi:MAG: hypothetical protein CM15mP22_7680 [Gammaproteobacteria bacterium]|nr:MAG: hypothetical protein CM15mP22_7680 [Gammaproteobacteria bacterium]